MNIKAYMRGRERYRRASRKAHRKAELEAQRARLVVDPHRVEVLTRRYLQKSREQQ